MKKKEAIQLLGGKKTRKKIRYAIPLRNKETGQSIEVTVFKPEQERETDPRPSMLNAARKCWELISKDDEGAAATRLLDKKGCDWVQLLAHVELYCQHPKSEAAFFEAEAAKYLAHLNKKIRKFDLKVEKWQSQINKINSQIEAELHVDAAAHAPDFEAYRATLHVAQVAALPSGKIPKIRQEIVVCLYHLVRLSTGRAHYKELADILQARLNANKYQELVSEGYFQTILKRFKHENPDRYRELAKAAQMGLKWAPFSEYNLV